MYILVMVRMFILEQSQERVPEEVSVFLERGTELQNRFDRAFSSFKPRFKNLVFSSAYLHLCTDDTDNLTRI
jgi:hypothetical protein